MADPIADLHMVLITCGVSVEETRTLIINKKPLHRSRTLDFWMGATMMLPRCRCVWRII